ncbi:RagB/SusD family nutrient uptake outer membrane protein [Flavobacterium sp.]|uniref:RagB/SusD family nutrient uptake outer membrane protein n=1 Tax=Flavobacterium sp. TaxID=239 RepID=UPI003752F2A1
MKKNIISLFSLLTILYFATISCGDNFVDRVAPYSLDSENYFNSESDYNQALIGAYDLLHSSYVNVLLGEIASDNTLSGGESATDVIGFQQIDDMNHSPINENLKNLWDWMSAGVQRTNYILEFKDKTDFPNKNQVIAETRFLRAYYRFELVKWFGGIPLKGDERFKVGDEKSVPRSSVQAVYANIESDLLFAVANLSPTAAQSGRATKGAAQALLGKAYLYQNKFVDASNVLESLINSGSYSLVTNYNTIFEEAGENNLESVFEIQYSDAQGASFDCLQCSEGNVAVGFSGVRSYAGPFFTSGFSFNVPTQEVVNVFEVGDNRKNVAILDIQSWAIANNASFGIGYKHTGFFNRKYLPRTRSASALGDLNLTNPNNYRAIRYADVLLMAAEAFNRGGINDAKARLYLNQVRQRAFADNNHNISASGAALTDFIYAERRVELVGEGHRFFDLVRTGKAAQEITNFTASKNELFPVPIEEIQFSNGNWQQNTGY